MRPFHASGHSSDTPFFGKLASTPPRITAFAISLHRSLNTCVAFVVLVGLFTATNLDRMPSGIETYLTTRLTVANVLFLGMFLLLWNGLFSAFGGYSYRSFKPDAREVARMALASGLASMFLLVPWLTSRSGSFKLSIVLWWGLVNTIMTTFSGLLVRRLAGIASDADDLLSVIIVGSGPRALAAYQRLRTSRRPKYQVLGFVDSPSHHLVAPEIRQWVLGPLENLDEILMRAVVDTVLIALPIKSCYSQIQQTIGTCERAGVEIEYPTDLFQLSSAHQDYDHHGGAPVVRLRFVQNDHRLIIKRCIDCVGAAVGLLLLAPLLILIAITIKLTSRGPVFFTQERYGLKKRRFRLYKFRTMVEHAESLQDELESKNEVSGPVFKIRNDPRITPIGKVLRRTSLDELPQLINILRGQMSLVGPRPLPVRDVSHFNDSWLMRRFSVKPGLTCLWQVNGRTDVAFDRWIEMDLTYIDNWSLSLDLKILAKTVPAVIRGVGAA